MKGTFNIIGLTMSLMLVIGLSVAEAAEYPTKPITLICPAAAGGSIDIMGRMFASVAEKYLGQPVIVLNRTGAGTMVGTAEGARANPDGYTLTIGSTASTIIVESEIASGRTPPFTRDDFIPIGSWASSPTLVVVPYDHPWKTLADLIKDCKTKPAHYAFCSGGTFSSSHFPAEIFLRAAGIKARHVPYVAAAPCISALVGGHVDFATQYPSTCIPLARGNKLRILAVQDDKRCKSLPNVPTVKELGIDAMYRMWQGILVPKKTAQPVVEKLREVFKKVVEGESFIGMVEKTGDEVTLMMGIELAKYWEKESEELARLYKQMIKEEKK
jgi:tripartite-type tricarboxylate transporter receptor subunit TctC